MTFSNAALEESVQTLLLSADVDKNKAIGFFALADSEADLWKGNWKILWSRQVKGD